MVSAHRFGLILGEQREVGGVLGVLAQASFQSVLFNWKLMAVTSLGPHPKKQEPSVGHILFIYK